MNAEDRIYRFNEIMATVELLPEEPDLDTVEVGDLTLPNLTRDLAEPEIYSAILCQSMRADEGFNYKLCTTLQASAVKSIDNAVEKGDKPTKDDLYALSISINIMWAHGMAQPLFNTLNMLGRVCDTFDLDIPDLARTVLRPNQGASTFGTFDPYDILKGMSIEQAMEILGRTEAE